MPRELKRSALVLTAFAALLCSFFEISKHNPGFSHINPFGEDPYDAVGSFAIQFVPMAALLALLRAFRPYPPGGPLEPQRRLLARTIFLGLAAICLTLLADAIALGRHYAAWSATSAGVRLAVWTGGFAFLAAGAVWWFCRSQEVNFRASSRGLAILSVCITILALYPEDLRRTLWGALLTAFTGLALFFVMVWAVGKTFIPECAENSADVLDDLSAIALRIFPKLSLRESRSEASTTREVVRRGPRKHPVMLAVLAGALIGFVLLGLELRGQWASMPLPRLILVSAVYLSAETTGVVVGYALLARPLHLFRGPVL